MVTVANGFIASAVVESLLEADAAVVACVRSSRNLPASPRLTFTATDLRRHTRPEAWREMLHGVDVVTNCAGILREARPGSSNGSTTRPPRALAEAALDAGVSPACHRLHEAAA